MPTQFTVPANTGSPVSLATGKDSPVSIDSSTKLDPPTTLPFRNGCQMVQWIRQIILANKKNETMEWLHTSTGIVSPGRTSIESPTRTSSTGTSTVIASEFKTLSEEGSSLDEVTINLD